MCVVENKNNKRNLTHVLSTFNAGETFTAETHHDRPFSHDQADITMIAYATEVANSSKSVIRVLSNVADVFVLLIYWVHRVEMECKMQMEQCDEPVLDTKATFGSCFAYKITALNISLTGHFP